MAGSLLLVVLLLVFAYRLAGFYNAVSEHWTIGFVSFDLSVSLRELQGAVVVALGSSSLDLERTWATVSVGLAIGICLAVWVRALLFIIRRSVWGMGASLLGNLNRGIIEDPPKELDDPDGAFAQLVNASAYRNDGIGPGSTAVLGLNAQYLPATSTEYTTVVSAKTFLLLHKAYFLLFPVALFGLAVGVFAYSADLSIKLDVLINYAIATFWQLPDEFLVVLVGLGLFCAAAFAADLAFARMLIPPRRPLSTRSISDIQGFAAMSPSMLNETLGSAIQGSQAPAVSKVYQFGVQTETIADTQGSEFRLKYLVEGSSTAVENSATPAANLRLLCGWIFVALGLVILVEFIVPAALEDFLFRVDGDIRTVALAPIYQGVLYWTAVKILRKGDVLITDGERLLYVRWFNAPMAAINVVGSTERAEVVLGAGSHDMVRTSATSQRCAFAANVHASLATFEAPSHNGERTLYAFQQSPEADDLVGRIKMVVAQMSSDRVRPVGIETTESENMRRLLDLNAASRRITAGTVRPPEDFGDDAANSGRLTNDRRADRGTSGTGEGAPEDRGPGLGPEPD